MLSATPPEQAAVIGGADPMSPPDPEWEERMRKAKEEVRGRIARVLREWPRFTAFPAWISTGQVHRIVRIDAGI